MVFFTCGACGESLKKAQVEKHVHLCRGCQVLSCIDCGKDFWGDDYQNHNRCISEDQKYGGRGYEAKANKGDVKQQQWLQKIHIALSKPGVSTSLRSVLQQVCTYDNVPRKRAKFQNWMRNSLKISNSTLHDEVWDILSADSDNIPEVPPQPKDTQPTDGGETTQKNSEKKKLNKRERKEARRQKNGGCCSEKNLQENQEPEHESVQRKEGRKRKHRDEEQNSSGGKKTKTKDQTDTDREPEEREEQVASSGKFNWKGNIKAVLRECPDQELSVKKLRKKVLAAYYSFTGDTNCKSEEEVLALFSKKINNNPKFRVLKDRVKLIK